MNSILCTTIFVRFLGSCTCSSVRDLEGNGGSAYKFVDKGGYSNGWWVGYMDADKKKVHTHNKSKKCRRYGDGGPKKNARMKEQS